MTATKIQPVAEICSASHDDAEFGERAIKPLRDISDFEYGTPLYAGAAPAAVAPQGDKDDSLLLCASDLQHSAIYDSHSEMQDCARSVADRIKALAAPALEAPAAPESAPWCPDVCPITGRPFFMWIDHWQTGKPVPTYGGPYDSYTIPVKDSDGSFECERYDHDEGGWLTEGAGWHCLGVRLVDDQSFVVDPSNPRYHEIEAFAAAAPQAQASAPDWWRGRADEIEVQVAATGNSEAMRCYTDMRTLLQAAAAPQAPAAPADAQAFAEWWDRERVTARNRLPGDDWMDLSNDDREQYEAAFNAGMRAAKAAPAAPAVDAETIEDAARFRAIANAGLTDDEAFDRALEKYPELGGDATIDDVRAMFDAARAAVAAQAKEGGA